MKNKSRYWVEQILITHPFIINYRQHSGMLRSIAIMRNGGFKDDELEARYIVSRYID